VRLEYQYIRSPCIFALITGHITARRKYEFFGLRIRHRLHRVADKARGGVSCGGCRKRELAIWQQVECSVFRLGGRPLFKACPPLSAGIKHMRLGKAGPSVTGSFEKM